MYIENSQTVFFNAREPYELGILIHVYSLRPKIYLPIYLLINIIFFSKLVVVVAVFSFRILVIFKHSI